VFVEVATSFGHAHLSVTYRTEKEYGRKEKGTKLILQNVT
jgi:hypothetical protein